MEYDGLEFKIPAQCEDYNECSAFVTTSVESIMKEAIEGEHYERASELRDEIRRIETEQTA